MKLLYNLMENSAIRLKLFCRKNFPMKSIFFIFNLNHNF